MKIIYGGRFERNGSSTALQGEWQLSLLGFHAPPITVFSVPTARLKAAWGWCCQEACLNKESRTSDWEGKYARKTKGATLWTKPLLTKPRAASIKIGNNS